MPWTPEGARKRGNWVEQRVAGITFLPWFDVNILLRQGEREIVAWSESLRKRQPTARKPALPAPMPAAYWPQGTA